MHLGATPVREQVVDGNIVTGAGVTSGIDFALQLAAMLGAKKSPAGSSFRSNTNPSRRSIPARRRKASKETLAAVQTRLAKLGEERRAVALRVGCKLGTASVRSD